MKLAKLALLCAALTSSVAFANTTFTFTGEVTNSGIGSLPVGTSITGQFQYDTATPSDYFHQSADGAQFAGYTINQPLVFQATAGAYQITSDHLDVTIQNNFNGNVEDTVNVSGGYALNVGDQLWENGSMGIVMASAPGHTSVLSSTALPDSIDLAQFDASGGNYGWLQQDGGPADQRLYFKLTAITSITSVPEVSSMAMSTLGLMAIGGLIGRRRIHR